MPLISEEDELSLPTADFAQLLQLPESTFAGSDNDTIGTIAGAGASLTCPAHPGATDCLCPGYMGEWDLPTTNVDPPPGLQEPDYTKFENWIPHFYRPEKSCDYCRSRRLNCYAQRGEAFCTPCKALFRECSLTNSNTLESNNYSDKHTGALIDTLHVVDEDVAIERGTFTGVKPMISKNRQNGTNTPVRADDAPGSTKRNGIRFPRHAVKLLRDWLQMHPDNPYPTEEEKVELEKQTELKPSQIANWLANARRRRKAAERTQPKLCKSPSLRATTNAIPIPTPDKPWDELNPFERWKNSPPENEPALMTDIANAVANSDLQEEDISTSPSILGEQGKRSSNASAISHLRAPSTTSQETGLTSSLSASNSAAQSHGSSNSQSTRGSFGSFSSNLAGKKARRRRRNPVAPAPGQKLNDDKKRMFQCTFCTDTFKSKYDWTRHEKSLHLSLEKWICAPLGPVIMDQETGKRRCVYCDLQDASKEHVESHNHEQCESKGHDARTFYRKDHLRQHLRLMHGCEMTPFMENWKYTAVQIRSRCGFCAQRFTLWQERVDHLTAHYKAGARMIEWKGCRGLDPAVAAQVTNAMPPYLIGIETVSPNPFSATNRASWRQLEAGPGEPASVSGHTAQQDRQSAEQTTLDSNPVKATCWEVLTVRLGKYARQMAEKGNVMTDEMLQAQARRILYDSDDPWNQTAADNPEWLDLFKKAHGLDFIPSAIGGGGDFIPEDLETYGDLGLRIPFAVQLQAYNQSREIHPTTMTTDVPDAFRRTLDRKQKVLDGVFSQIVHEGVLHDDHLPCTHAECSQNVIDLSLVNGSKYAYSHPKRWCTHSIPKDTAKELADVVAHSFSELPPEPENDASDHNVSSGDRTGWEWTTPGLTAAKSRAQGLEALARLEAPATDDCLPGHLAPCSSAKRGLHLPRHKYELPSDRAQQFETITGAWKDSGAMPQPVLTSPPSIEQPYNTSTGAMMEFLGGDIGASLPFSNDILTATIPLPGLTSSADPVGDLNWHLPDGEVMNDRQIEDLIRVTTTASEVSHLGATADAAMDITWPVTTTNATTTSTHSETLGDVNMDDLQFDDLTFDAMFDMPLDETFHLDEVK